MPNTGLVKKLLLYTDDPNVSILGYDGVCHPVELVANYSTPPKTCNVLEDKYLCMTTKKLSMPFKIIAGKNERWIHHDQLTQHLFVVMFKNKDVKVISLDNSHDSYMFISCQPEDVLESTRITVSGCLKDLGSLAMKIGDLPAAHNIQRGLSLISFDHSDHKSFVYRCVAYLRDGLLSLQGYHDRSLKCLYDVAPNTKLKEAFILPKAINFFQTVWMVAGTRRLEFLNHSEAKDSARIKKSTLNASIGDLSIPSESGIGSSKLSDSSVEEPLSNYGITSKNNPPDKDIEVVKQNQLAILADCKLKVASAAASLEEINTIAESEPVTERDIYLAESKREIDTYLTMLEREITMEIENLWNDMSSAGAILTEADTSDTRTTEEEKQETKDHNDALNRDRPSNFQLKLAEITASLKYISEPSDNVSHSQPDEHVSKLIDGDPIQEHDDHEHDKREREKDPIPLNDPNSSKHFTSASSSITSTVTQAQGGSPSTGIIKKQCSRKKHKKSKHKIKSVTLAEQEKEYALAVSSVAAGVPSVAEQEKEYAIAVSSLAAGVPSVAEQEKEYAIAVSSLAAGVPSVEGKTDCEQGDSGSTVITTDVESTLTSAIASEPLPKPESGPPVAIDKPVKSDTTSNVKRKKSKSRKEKRKKTKKSRSLHSPVKVVSSDEIIVTVRHKEKKKKRKKSKEKVESSIKHRVSFTKKSFRRTMFDGISMLFGCCVPND